MNPLYWVVKNNINSSNEGLRSIAIIFYCNEGSELKGFSNGLYAYMSYNNMVKPDYQSLRDSDLFIMLKELTKSVEFLKIGKLDKDTCDMINTLKKNYNYYFNRIVKTGEMAIKKWNKEAMRVINKYKRDAAERIPNWNKFPINTFI